MKISCSRETSFSLIIKMFSCWSFFSMILRIRKLSDCCWITISVISLTSCFADIPPSTFSPETPERLSLRIAANRTRKNSSKLFEKIPKNRSRSNKGTASSPASCNTLALNANQLFSRSIYLFSDT